jgi:HlyD family secretion protein
MKLFGLAIVVLSVAGGLAWFLPDRFGSVQAESSFEDASFVARRDNLRITVAENGYLKAKKSLELKPKFDGQGTITWLIDEGSEVAEGDLLVEFDSTDLETRLDEAKNSIIQYETELEAAQAELDIQERDNEADIEKADLTLEVKRMELKKYEEGEYPNTLRKDRLAVEKAVSTYERTLEQFKQTPQLFEEGFLTAIQVEEERIRLREAEITKENAEKDLELFETYTHPMTLKQKQSDLRDAERSLENAREKATINMKQKEARVQRQERMLSTTQAKLEKLEKDLGHHKMTAPQGGIVHYGDQRRSWYRERIKVGNQVYNGMTLITLPDLTEMQVLIDVHEADIDQVEKDQEVVITLDTYKGKTFKGKVTHIASVASSNDWGDNTNKQFRVEITMDELDIEVRAGITAKVEILVDELEDVLQIPIHAVFTEGEEHFCFVSGAQGFERRTVEIGRNNAHYIEVSEGLEAGETVLLYDLREEGYSEVRADEQDEEPVNGLPDALGGSQEDE